MEGKKNPVVTIEMEDGGVIRAALYPDIAPNTVNNFISLVKKGFYDDLIFHRVINGFMIQGGCPLGQGTGGPGYQIRGEFAANGFDNRLAHDPGVLSMARAMDPDSAGSQFFIMHMKAPHLDGQYAAFGKVTEGMDVVDADTGALYGQLVDVTETGANQVYHIRFSDGKIRLAPAIPQVVVSIRVEENRMELRPLPGLFEGAEEIRDAH